MKKEKKPKKLINATGLRYVGIALAVLSIGLAIAYAGFVWKMSQKEAGKQGIVSPTSSEKR